MNFSIFNLLRDLSEMRGEMNRMFGSFGSGRGRSGTTAAVNLYESPEQYFVVMEAAGADKDKFDVSLKGQNLVVKGEIPSTMPEKADMHRCERSCGEFQRFVELPGLVNPSKVDASFKDGLLTISIDKAEEQKPKQIKVEIA